MGEQMGLTQKKRGRRQRRLLILFWYDTLLLWTIVAEQLVVFDRTVFKSSVSSSTSPHHTRITTNEYDYCSNEKKKHDDWLSQYKLRSSIIEMTLVFRTREPGPPTT